MLERISLERVSEFFEITLTTAVGYFSSPVEECLNVSFLYLNVG